MMSSKPVLPKKYDRVELSDFDLEISPPNLTFGINHELAPVDVELRQDLALKNAGSFDDIHVVVSSVVSPGSSFKFRVKIRDRKHFVLKPGEVKTVSIMLNILCTTTVRFDISLKTWKEGGVGAKEVLLHFEMESEQTTKLDLDEIEIGDEIGRGGSFTAHRGGYRGREVAVRDWFYREEDLTLNRYVDDALNMLRRIQHRAVVEFIGAVLQPSRFIVVTEMLQLGNYYQALANHPNEFTEGLKVKCLLNIASAVLYLHDSRIIHRNIKPSKIGMVSLDMRADICAKLMDPTMAIDLGQEETIHDPVIVGTPLYMAPEVLNDLPFGTSADVYSFAMTMNEVFSGEDPFQGEVFQSFADFREARTAREHLQVPQACPPEIAEMIERCSNAQPSTRPSFYVIHSFLLNYFNRNFVAH